MKKNLTKNIASVFLAAVLMITSGITCFASAFDTKVSTLKDSIVAQTFNIDFALAGDSTINKIYSFINDARWNNGTAWNSNQTPKSSTYHSWGCCAYTADFAKYVYGVDDPYAGRRYYNINDIVTGDIIYVNGHWFAVLNRTGNTLTCAEGNWGSRVVIGRQRTFNASTKKFSDNYEFQYGIHYTNYCPTFTTPSAPAKVTGLKATKTTQASVSLSWNRVSGTGVIYEVWDGNKRLTTTTGTSYTHSGLKAKSTHTYQVRAFVQYVGNDYTVRSVYGKYNTALVVITKKK